MVTGPTDPPKDNQSKKIKATAEHRLRAFEALARFGKEFIVLRNMLLNVGIENKDVIDLIGKAFNEAQEANPKLGAIENLDPIPLFPTMRVAFPYPIEALGPILSQAAKAIAHKVQVPPEMAAQSVLAYAALAAQSLADVLLPHEQRVLLSLYCITIAETGDRKTAADLEAGWPIREYEHELMCKYNKDDAFYEINLATWETGKKNADKKKASSRGRVGGFLPISIC